MIDLQEIEKQYPKFNLKEKNNPLSFGDIFGQWIILYRTNNSKYNQILYVCQCSCGTIKSISKTNLINGKSSHCNNCKGKNLINQVFTKLTVINKAANKNHRGYWHCRCACGNECDVNTSALLSGHVQSCGCLHKEAQHNRREDLTNKRFGKLVAMYPIPTLKNDKLPRWHCLCDCGNECNVTANALKSESTKSCGCIKSFEEENIIKLLKNNNIPFLYQYSFNDMQKYKFDFYVNNTYIIEYDGKLHFIFSKSSWNTKELVLATHQRDLIKNLYCFNNNIPIIRIPYLCDYNINDLLLNTTRFLLTPDNENIYYKKYLKC